MNRLPPLGLAALIAVACIAGTARADETEGDLELEQGGRASVLVPAAQTPARLAALEIAFDLGGRPPAWTVAITHRIENPTDAALRVPLALVETPCDREAERCTAAAGRFRRVEVTSQSARLRPRSGRLAATHPLARGVASPPRAQLVEVTVAPHQTVEVVARYALDRTSGLRGDLVRVLAGADGLWSGPIAEARLTLRTPVRAWGFTYPRAFQVASRVERPAAARGRGGTTEIVLHAQALAPATEIAVELQSVYRTPLADVEEGTSDCPSYAAVEEALSMPAADRAEALNGIADDAGSLHDAQLCICKNILYASHGYPFRNRWARRHLYDTPPPDPNPADGIAIAGYSENPHYADTLLTETDRAYSGLIESMLAARHAPRTRAQSQPDADE